MKYAPLSEINLNGEDLSRSRMSFFGIQDVQLHNILSNYIILESKFFLYCSKINKSPLSVPLLIAKIKNALNIKRFIARENSKLKYHYEKWEPLLPLILPSRFVVLFLFFENFICYIVRNIYRFPWPS